MMWFSAMELQAPEGKGVYNDMDQWIEIRKKILVEGVSKRQVMEEEGIHWETLKKILEDDKHIHKKQHHTAKRIFERLCAEDGYTGGYTQVKKAVRGLKQRNSE